MTWRGWAAWAAAGCAGVLAWRGDWHAAAIPALTIAVVVAWRVRGELLATREMLRAAPVPGRHRTTGRPRELQQVPAGETSRV